jgi:hypothetical protein
MNPHSPTLQPAQVRFGGCRLTREIDSSSGGVVTWLAENTDGSPCLLHVLPQTRLLTEDELRPLHRLRHHGQRSGRAVTQMTLANICTEEGRTPVTALVESFPPLPVGATEWMPLLDWVKLHGKAAPSLVSPLLPTLARLAADLPEGGHGSLGPAHLWLACAGPQVHGVVFSHAGLSATASAQADAHGLAAALFYWLIGQAHPSQPARVRALLHEARHGKETIPPAWQEAISCCLDRGASFFCGSALELAEQMQNPGSSAAEGAFPSTSGSVPLWQKVTALAATALLGFVLLSQINRASPPLAQQLVPAPSPTPSPEPEFIPLPAPQPPVEEPAPQPEKIVQAPPPPAPMPGPEKPVPAPEPPAKEEAKSTPPVARGSPSSPKRTEATPKTPSPTRIATTAPRVRVPYRPPPLAGPAAQPAPKALALSAKKAPLKENPSTPSKTAPQVPRAIPVAKAVTVSPPQDSALWQRVPSAGKITQAVPVPEDAPAPRLPDRLPSSGVLPGPQPAEISPLQPPPEEPAEAIFPPDFQANFFYPGTYPPSTPTWDWWAPLWGWLPWSPPPAYAPAAPLGLPAPASPAAPQRARVPGQPDQPLWQRP